ncbi:hypothetical protein HBA54_28060 [Pelagibius litoralis]|uniref:Uncharacterized protein n=1 Tax=Pelagibius litoralis TaxID=374515 RepID=A0A967KDT4_9PROT|nr:hypothetical protein [Pelagibius litoralis]NIA72447.1 hypothetical protein [Pelagibius litoralis]
MTKPNYRGEAQLLSWSDTPAGRKITFLLPDEGEEHPFKPFKTGPKYGQAFAVITQPVDYDNPEGEGEPKAGEPVKSVAGYAKAPPTESQICGMLCNDPGFQEWVAESYAGIWDGWRRDRPGACLTEICTIVTREIVGVQSRSELDRPTPTNTHIESWQALRAQYEIDTGKIAEKRR